VTCPMVEGPTIDHRVSEQGLKTHTGVEVVVKHTHTITVAKLNIEFAKGGERDPARLR
jgi:hypothetical protein